MTNKDCETVVLAPREQDVYDLFRRIGYETDIHILYLYYFLRNDRDNLMTAEIIPRDLSSSVRDEQQYVGTYIRRVNMKLVNEQIVPGRIKKTYRLTRLNQP